MNVSGGESSEIISASGNSEHRFSCRSEPQSNSLLLILVFLLYLLVVYFKKKTKKNVMTHFFSAVMLKCEDKKLKKKSSSIPLPFYRVSQFSAVNGRSLGQSGQGHVTIHLNHSHPRSHPWSVCSEQ